MKKRSAKNKLKTKKIMGWLTYYHLLEKYNGDLSKATEEEMNFAFRDNPNAPPEARALAEKKWEEKIRKPRIEK